MIHDHDNQDKSVWDVIQIYLHQLLRAQNLIARARRAKTFDDQVFNTERLKFVSETLDTLNIDLEKMKLRLSIKQLRCVKKKLKSLIENPPQENIKIEAILLGKALDELQGRVEDELEISLLYYFNSKEKERIKQTGKVFGTEVWKKLPEARDELNEAVSCMGFSRWTASVCHMMRAIECVLHVISDRLGVTVKPNWNWGTIIREIDKKIETMPKGDEKDYWFDVKLHILCIKNCRLKSMHVRAGYMFGQEDAEKIYQAVKGFLQSLAKEI
ncbi:MAG: hypothetical protein OXC42_08980 [Gammaproteobacteria bacterium]|nr:hypothetical protein [Gammaproteobacteria bacterium]